MAMPTTNRDLDLIFGRRFVAPMRIAAKGKKNMPQIVAFIAVVLLTATFAFRVGGQSATTQNQSAPPQAPAGAAQTPAASATAPATPAAATPATNTPAKLAVAPMSPALLHARELYRTGKLDSAVAEYSLIVTAGGNDASAAYAGLARAYLKQKNLGEANTAAQKSVALNSDLADAHTALGEVYFRQGKISESENEFQFANRNSRADARAYLGLNRIYRATSNYKKAKIALDIAHQIDPSDPEIRRAWLGTLGFKERLKAMQEYLDAGSNDDQESLDNLKHSMVLLEDEMNRPVRGCRLITKITSTQTSLERLMVDAKRIKGYGLKVKLNDTMTRLLLDTGASGILVNSKIAENAGVQHVVDQNIKGIGDSGAAGGYIGYANSIEIGELQFQNCYVRVVDKKSSMGEDGFIGADVFSHFLVDINLPDAKFQLSELPKLPDEPVEETSLDSNPTSTYHPRDRYIAPEMKDYTKILRFGHTLLVPTSVNDHPYKLFLLDTGAFDDTITPEAARETTKVHADDRMHVKGFSGQIKDIYVADDVSLTFGHLRQRRNLISFDMTNTSNAIGTEVSGTLGFGMLYLLDIKIDYRDGLVNFSFDPNRNH
jgi:tetratricopeptide (TPR) repeat protein